MSIYSSPQIEISLIEQIQTEVKTIIDLYRYKPNLGSKRWNESNSEGVAIFDLLNNTVEQLSMNYHLNPVKHPSRIGVRRLWGEITFFYTHNALQGRSDSFEIFTDGIIIKNHQNHVSHISNSGGPSYMNDPVSITSAESQELLSKLQLIHKEISDRGELISRD